MPEILYKPHDGYTMLVPHRGSKGAAGWDLHAAETATLLPYQYCLIATGFDVCLPDGHCLLIVPRSGFSIKNQIITPNSLGVIDEDYRGHMKLATMWIPDPARFLKLSYGAFGSPTGSLSWDIEAYFTIKQGDRIAQALLVEYKEQIWKEVNELPRSERGERGFGHTGLRPVGVTDPHSST